MKMMKPTWAGFNLELDAGHQLTALSGRQLDFNYNYSPWLWGEEIKLPWHQSLWPVKELYELTI